MDAEDANSPTTKLLTLLNVSALKSRKRAQVTEDPHTNEKLNKRHKSIKFTENDTLAPSIHQDESGSLVEHDGEKLVEETTDGDPAGS